HIHILQWLRFGNTYNETSTIRKLWQRLNKKEPSPQPIQRLCWKAKACASAAENGHLEMLQYLHENGCPWDREAFSNAVKNGHLQVVQYLHENGCPWDDKVSDFAVEEGHLQVLQYLHDNGFPWSEDLIT